MPTDKMTQLFYKNDSSISKKKDKKSFKGLSKLDNKLSQNKKMELGFLLVAKCKCLCFNLKQPINKSHR